MGLMQDMQTLQYLQQGAASQQSPMGTLPQQSMQQQMPQRRNPLEAGSMAAIEAAKRSLEMNDVENQRALGRALIAMAYGMKNSQSHGQGLAGNIGALTDGLAPAISAYDQERSRIENLNYAIAQKQKEEAALARKEEREMKKMTHEMEIAQKRLAVEQGYFGLEQKKIEREKQLEEEMSKAGANIPLGRLAHSPHMHGRAMADIKSYIEKGDSAIPALQAIDTIENVLTRDPDITKHWGVISLAAQRKDPGYVNQQLANKVPEKTRYHAELLAKSLATLPVSKFKGIPAKGLTVFAEKLISGMSPSMDMSSKTILKMVKPDKKFYQHTIDARDSVYENLEKGIYHIPKPMALELDKWDEEEVDNPYLGLSDSELAAKEAEIKRQLGGY